MRGARASHNTRPSPPVQTAPVLSRPRPDSRTLACEQQPSSIWRAVEAQANLAVLEARRNRVGVQLARLSALKAQLDEEVEAARQQLEQTKAAYVPDAADLDLAKRQAALLLGARVPRAFQLEAACASYAGHDVWVIQQAGVGKSACFQIAALMQRPPSRAGGPRPAKLTLVVTPLVALAREQADALNALRQYALACSGSASLAYVLDGVHDDALLAGTDASSSTLQRSELVAALRGGSDAPPLLDGSSEAMLLRRLQELDVRGDGTCVVLFVAPEKVARGHQLHALLRTVYELRLWRDVVVDEAHCVHEHGREFRPDYLLLGALRDAFSEITYMCLTATAPPEVVVATSLSLGVRSDAVLFRGSLKRAQMRYCVYFASSTNGKVELVGRMVAEAHARRCSTLIYVRTRRDAERTADTFRVICGLPARDDAACHALSTIEAYHAGMTTGWRSHLEVAWREGVIKQMAATTALGMGMDKPDLDAVFHACLPQSVGALYQEASRAARGGQSGDWKCVFTMADVFELLERRHGQVAASAAGHEYGYGHVLALLRWLLDPVTCRHVLLARALGGTMADATDVCRSCNPTCDNCERRLGGGAVEHLLVERSAWIPALLELVHKCECEEGRRGLSLRKLAASWLRAPTAPRPAWVRAPLFLHAFLHGIFSVTFVPIHRVTDELLSGSSSMQTQITSWSARVTVDVRGRQVADSCDELEHIVLHTSMWAVQASANMQPVAGDTVEQAEVTAQEIEAGTDEDEDECELDVQEWDMSKEWTDVELDPDGQGVCLVELEDAMV